MSEREGRLRQFFGSYFHPEWRLEGAKTWQDVVTKCFRDGRPEEARLLGDDLRSWLTEAKAVGNPLAGLPLEFGCSYDPTASGVSEMDWVAQIVAHLEKLLAN
jgi:hypothetical protein